MNGGGPGFNTVWRCAATQREVDDTTIEFCPADLREREMERETDFARLGNQIDWSFLRREIRSPGSFTKQQERRDPARKETRSSLSCYSQL